MATSKTHGAVPERVTLGELFYLRMMEMADSYWPPTLMLISYDTSLVLIHTADYERFVACGSDVVRDGLIIATFPNIKTDGVTP